MKPETEPAKPTEALPTTEVPMTISEKIAAENPTFMAWIEAGTPQTWPPTPVETIPAPTIPERVESPVVAEVGYRADAILATVPETILPPEALTVGVPAAEIAKSRWGAVGNFFRKSKQSARNMLNLLKNEHGIKTGSYDASVLDGYKPTTGETIRMALGRIPAAGRMILARAAGETINEGDSFKYNKQAQRVARHRLHVDALKTKPGVFERAILAADETLVFAPIDVMGATAIIGSAEEAPRIVPTPIDLGDEEPHSS